MKDLRSPLDTAAAQALEARFARRVTAALDEGSRSIAPDLTQRLKFAREQALRARKTSPAPIAVAELAFAGAAAGRRQEPGAGWGLRLGSLLPLVALLAGLFLIQSHETNSQVSAAADVDAALLTDDVPPAAYDDPGFVEFLKGTRSP